VLYQNKLIVPMDNAGESFLAALDVGTGKNLWKTERPRDINWVTPTIREINSSEAEILLQGPRELTVFDANTGKKKWNAPAPSSAPSATFADGLLVLPTGGVTVYKPGEGKLEEVWKSPKYRTGYSSPLYYDGRVYAANPTGVVYCADAKTGKSLWEERLQGKQTFSASPVAGDGKIYVLSETGRLLTIKSGDTGDNAEILGTSELKEEGLATPAISDGALFIRTDKNLWCIGAKK
jgi:glucose dehydrogenase